VSDDGVCIEFAVFKRVEADVAALERALTSGTAPSAGATEPSVDEVRERPKAIAAAPFFLTPTQCFGRPSKRCSHWPYITDLAETDDRATLKFTDVQKPERVLLEIRTGGGGHAAQTVFPGSVHPSGETIAWEGKSPSSNTPIPKVDGADLKQRAAKIAACALLAQNYPKAGGRHEGAIVVTGFLCRCGFPAPAIKIFIEALAVATCHHGIRAVFFLFISCKFPVSGRARALRYENYRFSACE
jgi:hypothetical protein